jgi:hypothetical protein
MFTPQSLSLVPIIIPSLALGVPLGHYIIRRVRPETFRRICMSADAWVVAFGLSTILRQLNLAGTTTAYALLVSVALIDAVLLYRFFRSNHPENQPTIEIASDQPSYLAPHPAHPEPRPRASSS